MRQLKIDVLSALVVTDKWESLSISLRATASVYLSPRSGRHIHSEAVEPRSGGTPRKRKEQSEPRRQEWAAESEALICCIAFCHPDLRRGSGFFWVCTSGYARHADA